MYDQTVRYANWMLSQGVQPGDLVAMYLWNSPDFYMIWFAMWCVGAAPSFINYNLEGKALLHCLEVCQSKLIIIDAEVNCQKRISESREELEKMGMKIVTLDDQLRQELSTFPLTVPGDEYRENVKPEFPYALIYTRFVWRLSSQNVQILTGGLQWHNRPSKRMSLHDLTIASSWSLQVETIRRQARS